MTYGTKDGTGYASDLPELQDMSGQAFFKEAMKGSRVVSDPIESPLDGTDLIVLAVPVYDSSGGVTGVLAGSFDVSRLSEIFFGDLYGGAGYVYIINSAGESIMMDKKHGEARRGKTFFAVSYTHLRPSAPDAFIWRSSRRQASAPPRPVLRQSAPRGSPSRP